jgi:hypothetical protein
MAGGFLYAFLGCATSQQGGETDDCSSIYRE